MHHCVPLRAYRHVSLFASEGLQTCVTVCVRGLQTCITVCVGVLQTYATVCVPLLATSSVSVHRQVKAAKCITLNASRFDWNKICYSYD